jgi:hypothetical protein
VEIEIGFAGEVVERQELLNGTETVSLEGTSADGAWTMSALVAWNIGLVSSAGEGDITFVRDDGSEIFGSLLRGEVVETVSEDSGEQSDHTMRLEYDIDGGSGAFESATGRCRAVGTLSAATFRGTWSLALDDGAGADADSALTSE